MKNIIIAIATAGFMTLPAAAEITLSGDAKMGIDYNSSNADYMSKHSFVHEVNVDFMANGATDGGLTFGATVGLDGEDMVAHVGGSFGTISIGDVDSADEIAGSIADIGLFDIGVNDKVHGMMGGTASQLRYDATFGSVSIAVSAGTSDAVKGMPEVRTKVHTIAGMDEVRSPIVKSEAPTLWFLTEHGGSQAVSYMMDPTKPMSSTYEKDMMQGTSLSIDRTSYYDTAFGVQVQEKKVEDAYELDSIDVSVADVNTNRPVLIPIMGFIKEMDGDTVSYKKPSMTEGEDPMMLDEGTNELAAVEKYDMYYNLGADNAVGGTGENADTPKVDEYIVHNGTEASGGEVLVAATDPVTVGGDLITAAVPEVASENQYAFGASFDAGNFTIGAGYDSTKTISLGGGATFGDFSTNALFSKNADDAKGIGLDVGYDMNASTITLAYSTMKPKSGDADKSYGLGVTHDLGGGAAMNAGFGKVDDSNKASVGLSFAF